MFLFQFYIFQLVLVFFALFVQAEKVMRPRMKELKVWSDEKYVKHFFTFDPLDPHINITSVVVQELNDIDISWIFLIVQKADHSYYANYNSTFNICKILNWHHKSPLGSLVRGYLKEYGHLMKGCPVVKGKYYVHKFWIPEDPSISSLPELDFDITIEVYHVDVNKQRVLIAKDHLVGEVVVQDVCNVKRGLLAMLPPVGK